MAQIELISMDFKPRPFDNSDEAIEKHKKQVEDAKDYLFHWMKHAGFSGCDTTYLDFEDIASVMADYKLHLNQTGSGNQTI